MIVHYYHLYCSGTGSFRALQDHLAQPLPDEVRVGLVGPLTARQRFYERLPSHWKIVAEADSGYEQVTLACIPGSIADDDIVVYSHSKGAANDTPLNSRWRQNLEAETFRQHPPEAGAAEDIYVTSWLTEPVDRTARLPAGCSGFSPGNYWWARGAYLNRLPRPDPMDPDRYAAETWLGTADPPPLVRTRSERWQGPT